MPILIILFIGGLLLYAVIPVTIDFVNLQYTGKSTLLQMWGHFILSKFMKTVAQGGQWSERNLEWGALRLTSLARRCIKVFKAFGRSYGGWGENGDISRKRGGATTLVGDETEITTVRETENCSWRWERCSQNGNARRIENRERKSGTEKENRIEFTKTKIRAAFKSYMTVGALILAVL